jgi:hypothetical protein
LVNVHCRKHFEKAPEMTVSSAGRKDWKVVANAIEEVIGDDKKRSSFYKGLSGRDAYQTHASHGTIHLSLLGSGGYGKVWKVGSLPAQSVN